MASRRLSKVMTVTVKPASPESSAWHRQRPWRAARDARMLRAGPPNAVRSKAEYPPAGPPASPRAAESPCRIGRAGDRQSGGRGKSVAVRVDPGGRLILTKKTQKDK